MVVVPGGGGVVPPPYYGAGGVPPPMYPPPPQPQPAYPGYGGLPPSAPASPGLPPGYALDADGNLVPAGLAATQPAVPQNQNANKASSQNANKSGSTSNNANNINIVLDQSDKTKKKKKTTHKHGGRDADEDDDGEEEDRAGPPRRKKEEEAAADQHDTEAPALRVESRLVSAEVASGEPSLTSRLWPALARRAQETFRRYAPPGAAYNPAWDSRIRDLVEQSMEVRPDQGEAPHVAELAAEAGARVTEFVVDRVMAETKRQRRAASAAARPARIACGLQAEDDDDDASSTISACSIATCEEDDDDPSLLFDLSDSDSESDEEDAEPELPLVLAAIRDRLADRPKAAAPAPKFAVSIDSRLRTAFSESEIADHREQYEGVMRLARDRAPPVAAAAKNL